MDSLAAPPSSSRFEAAPAPPAFQHRTATSNLLAAIKACAAAGDLARGRAIHDAAVASGAAANPFVASGLVSMYARCGSVREARRIFDAMPCRGTVSWTAMIQGYVENKEELVALDLFVAMARNGRDCRPNGRTFVAVLKACSRLAIKEEMIESMSIDGELVKIKALETVMAIHAAIDRDGCGVDVFVANALLDAYSKCGSLVDASKVFSSMVYRDVVSWTSIIFGFAENSRGEMALFLFDRMLQQQGCCPNSRTFLAAVKAVADLGERESSCVELDDANIKIASLENGMALHSLCVRSSCRDRVFESARFFDDVVIWTALILACSNDGGGGGGGEAALEVYLRMRRCGCDPDTRTYVPLLKVCGKAVALRLVKAIHGELCRRGSESGAIVANAIIDAYGKCGSVDNAEKVFYSILSPDAVAHTSLMTGMCRRGEDDSENVFEVFREMLDRGLRVDGIAFLCLLTACSHAGLVERGKRIFEAMQMPRTNHLEEAMELLEGMPFEATAVTWTTMLTWCSKWKNARIGKVVFGKCLEIDGKNAAAYQLMANL